MFRYHSNNLFKSCLIGEGGLKSLSLKQNIILIQQKRSVSVRIETNTDKSKTDFLKWILLAMPVTSFGLGYWQIHRRQWKLALIKSLFDKTNAEPVELPTNLKQLDSMEYHTVKVRGHFLNDREFVYGPRSNIQEENKHGGSSFFQNSTSNVGYLVVTPFKLSNREETILVNRGWVHNKLKKQSTRPEGLIEDEVELVGVVRLHEERADYMPKNNPSKEQWLYRNLREMSNLYGTAPVWLDAKGPTDSPTPKGWPVPNQTRVTLRNEHGTYIVTFFGLFAATSWMWIRLYLRKLPLP